MRCSETRHEARRTLEGLKNFTGREEVMTFYIVKARRSSFSAVAQQQQVPVLGLTQPVVLVYIHVEDSMLFSCVVLCWSSESCSTGTQPSSVLLRLSCFLAPQSVCFKKPVSRWVRLHTWAAPEWLKSFSQTFLKILLDGMFFWSSGNSVTSGVLVFALQHSHL